ncbi:large conductance mechanosensitive channel protein MscL [Occallatibacter riparius]|uniref:Large-conductance mechanosensitive channel n=1 Tax=Occallatibacter riparius TaxID=1002689 RepID=A0A9J7BI17_9BACT|nr:large conductance mechanosensitive channel protein MscL [Occallatibacter riparius]UWZ82359.1 large conductance mechanosensitive channel protein MscL [Occallatibacter riparius]
MLKGFRDFILRGNVVDLAVAVVVGAAFTAIVTSFVTNILNPLIAATVGKPNFGYIIFHLGKGEIKIGEFLNATIYFVIVAAVVYFGVVMPMAWFLQRMKKAEPVAAPATKKCPECLSDIPLEARRCAHCTQPVPVG